MTTVSWFAAALIALIALMPIAQPASTFKADPPKACDDCDDWNRPRTPDKVFGTTHNVGVAGLSSVLITSNDFAGAWAQRPDGQAMLPMVNNEPRQREFSFRAGVNIVMYTLTGNYKADQVHIPALLERLGQ